MGLKRVNLVMWLMLATSLATLAPRMALAQVYFSDNFENGLGKWSVSGQDWDTTSTTFSSASHSVTDSPKGNYQSNANAELTSAGTIDLSTSNSPVLKFWQLFITQGNADYCRVRISDDGGFNYSEITRFSGGHTTWGYVELDLSAHKSSRIKIQFQLTSDGPGFQYDGWYLDDIIIAEKNNKLTPFPFFENFESGLSNWLASKHLGWDTTSTSYSSANHSITDSRIGNYPSSSNTTIVLANDIDLRGTNAPVLSFWQKYYTQGNADYCYVEVSQDGGFNWSELSKYSGGHTTWSYIQLDLSAFKSSRIRIRFRVRADGPGFEYDGWYLDDISIAEKNNKLTPFPFFENFESGLGNWLVSDHLGWDTTSTTFRSRNHSITDSRIGNYPSSSNTTFLLANPIYIDSNTTPVLSFWHKYATQGNADFCYVEISKDGGFTWTLLATYSGIVSNWHSSGPLDLSLYKGGVCQIRFRLRADGPGFEYDGWYLDDIEINDANGTPPPRIDSFTADPTFGSPPLRVAFQCSAHVDNGNITQYRWDFDGDNNIDSTTTSGSVIKIYTKTGTFQATCTVVDNSNRTASRQVSIQVIPSRTISIPDTSARTGVSINVPINISDAIGVAGAAISLTFDQNVIRATKVALGTVASGFSISDTISSGKVAIAMARATGLSGGSGSLAVVTFTVVGSPGNTTTITFKSASLYDASTKLIESTKRNGLFTVGITDGPTRIVVSPRSDSLRAGQTRLISASGRDNNGATISVNPTWQLRSNRGNIGSISPAAGTSTTFTATGPGDGYIIATQSGLRDSALVVVTGTRGDINIDGIVNVQDAILCLQINVKLWTPSPYQKWAADFDGDKEVKVDDAQDILNESLGRLLQKRALAKSSSGVAFIRLGRFQEEPNGMVVLSLIVEGRDDVSAANFEVDYNDAKLSVVEVSSALESSLMAHNVRTPGKLHIAMISADGLVRSNGEVLLLKFRAKGELVECSEVTLNAAQVFDARSQKIDSEISEQSEAEQPVPNEFSLQQNYPNPFNPTTKITYALPEKDHIRVIIFDLLGKEVRVLFEGESEAGTHALNWDARDGLGRSVPSGVYVYCLEAKTHGWRQIRKMVLLK